ncbi:predicted protein [Pyrenophora tritici-repentis Pt-1C-BFP]|uniref:Uncharacterized protein n=1 Tax=Pyrenophora tritici-repentis (strain Pt-1C-BFP) TaxID=426418 RepID=B2WQ27_PYRTR|nr:uncharacterized protein PTRG_12095 [Pyrenophora tritici-repentis Pt-1C-BFP]EDU46243.1 predicted protein [Pyrenophora tritici-repentis Pt-1C-BFP]
MNPVSGISKLVRLALNAEGKSCGDYGDGDLHSSYLLIAKKKRRRRKMSVGDCIAAYGTKFRGQDLSADGRRNGKVGAGFGGGGCQVG